MTSCKWGERGCHFFDTMYGNVSKITIWCDRGVRGSEKYPNLCNVITGWSLKQNFIIRKVNFGNRHTFISPNLHWKNWEIGNIFGVYLQISLGRKLMRQNKTLASWLKTLTKSQFLKSIVVYIGLKIFYSIINYHS